MYRQIQDLFFSTLYAETSYLIRIQANPEIPHIMQQTSYNIHVTDAFNSIIFIHAFDQARASPASTQSRHSVVAMSLQRHDVAVTL